MTVAPPTRDQAAGGSARRQHADLLRRRRRRGLDDDSRRGLAAMAPAVCRRVECLGDVRFRKRRRIDAHDAVFRMNHTLTLGYETDVGGRTSIVVLNTTMHAAGHLLFHRNTGRARRSNCAR